MCVIAVREPGATLPLPQMWDANPDGAGIMYVRVDEGKRTVQVKRGLMTLRALERAVNAVGDDATLIVHCRIGTSGPKSAASTHPWRLGPRAALAHNGILSGWGSVAESDTSAWVSSIGKALYEHDPTMSAPVVQQIIQATCHASSSRMVVLTPDTVYRYGSGWTERDGIWYSSMSWSYVRESVEEYARDGKYIDDADYDHDWLQRVLERRYKRDSQRLKAELPLWSQSWDQGGD